MWKTLPRHFIAACRSGGAVFRRNVLKSKLIQSFFGDNASFARFPDQKTDDNDFTPASNNDQNMDSDFYMAFLTDANGTSEVHDVNTQTRELDTTAAAN